MKSTLQLLKAILLLLSTCIIGNKIYCQAGTLDLDFGNGGKVITTMHSGNEGVQKEQIQKLLIQRNQRIVAAGFLYLEPGGYDVSLARYNPDGSLDKSFGRKGKVRFSYPVKSFYCNDAALQSDDKIIVVGNQTSPYQAYPLLMRFTKKGSVDSSFGLNGFIDTTGRINNNFINVGLLSDNSVIIAGYASNYNRDSSYTFIEKYSSNGIKDTNFGSNGKVILRRAQNYIFINSIVIQPDDKILLSARNTGTIDSSFLFRFTDSGKHDLTFGDSGKVITGSIDNLNPSDTLNSECSLPVLRNDGKIIILGAQYAKNFLVQYNSYGMLDSSFGINGKVIINDNIYKTSILIQKDNKIIIGGNFVDTSQNTNSYVNFAISKFNTNGSIDSSFGNDGKTVTDFGIYASSICTSLQPDGKIIQGGYSLRYLDSGAYSNFALCRYNNNGILPVSLLSFTATKQQQSVLLNWQTANEINNNYFSIERSNNNRNFGEINKLQSTNNPSKINSYTAADLKPLNGWNYYRLKQVDKDGKFTYSSIASVLFNDNILITVYPNPANNFVYVDGLKENLQANILITDTKGKTVLTVETTQSSTKINIQNLSSGIYYITIIQDGKTIKQKFIKQ